MKTKLPRRMGRLQSISWTGAGDRVCLKLPAGSYSRSSGFLESKVESLSPTIQQLPLSILLGFVPSLQEWVLTRGFRPTIWASCLQHERGGSAAYCGEYLLVALVERSPYPRNPCLYPLVFPGAFVTSVYK